MTIAAPVPSDWCFDLVDISASLVRRVTRAATPPGQEHSSDFTAAVALGVVFKELCHEADRLVRDRINEALRQWHLRRHDPPKAA